MLTDKDKAQEEMTMEEYMNLEEQIDAERERISQNGTKVNDATFKEWKRKRDEFRAQEKDEKVRDVFKSKLTGVQLFKNQSELFKDDENAEDVKMDEIENNVLDDEEDKKEDVKEVEEGVKDIKINEELFKEEENLDELDKIIDDEEDVKDGEKEQ